MRMNTDSRNPVSNGYVIPGSCAVADCNTASITTMASTAITIVDDDGCRAVVVDVIIGMEGRDGSTNRTTIDAC